MALYILSQHLSAILRILHYAHLDIIKNIETLYAEDTRVTKHLLEHYGIQATVTVAT